MQRRPPNRLADITIIAVVIITGLLALTIGSYIQVNNAAEINRSATNAINMAGRQEMLAQSIELNVVQASNTSDMKELEQLGTKLLRSTEKLSESHQLLSLDTPNSPLTPGLRSIYFEGEPPLDRDIRSYLKAAQAIAEGLKINGQVDSKDVETIVDHQSGAMPHNLNRVVLEIEEQAERSLARQLEFQTWTLAATAAAFIVLALFVFFPIHRRLSATLSDHGVANESLKERATERTIDLSQSEKRFRDFAEATSDWLWETDAEHRCVFVSAPISDGIGSDPQAYIGRTLQDIFTENYPEPSQEMFFSAIKQKLPIRDLVIRRHESIPGASWVRISAIPIFDDAGHFTGYRGTGKDVTQRYEQEHLLKERSEVLRTVLDTLDHAVTAFDKDLRLIAWNRHVNDLLEIPSEIIRHNEPLETFFRFNALRGEYGPGDSDEQVKARIELTRDFKAHKFIRERNDGTFIEVTGNPMPDGGFVTTYGDVTERLQNESELRRFRGMLDRTHDCVFIFDPQSLNFVYVNRGATEQVGYSEDELLQMTPYEIKPEFDENSFRALIRPMLDGDHDAVVFETTHEAKDGSIIPVEISLQFISDETDGRFIAIVRDISERKVAEQAFVSAKEEAEYANRAKSEFLANVSHELRTPLNAIMGFAEAMRMQLFGPIGDDRYYRYAEDIHQSGEHLLGIINDILDLSRVEAGETEIQEEEQDIRSLVDASLRFVRDRAQMAEVALTTEIPDDLPLLLADDRLIKQMLINLLSNAVKFTPQGGRILVRAEIGTMGSITLSVSDTGIGMAEDQIPRALTTFGQIGTAWNRNHDGTGLGLPLVKSLIELHGGALHLESEPGFGTTASLSFPSERTVIAN